tara:strand:- start:117 stop:407 length:291 start_codon:yes stop_codon:yes gene_type:complete
VSNFEGQEMYRLGPMQENAPLNRHLLIPRFGVHGSTFDATTKTMDCDMETDFVPEEFMYDLPEAPPTWSCRWRHPGPDYPPEAPKFKDPIREAQPQ